MLFTRRAIRGLIPTLNDCPGNNCRTILRAFNRKSRPSRTISAQDWDSYFQAGAKSPRHLEQAERQFVRTTIAAFAISFAIVGAFVGNGTFGTWMRPAVYGVLGTFLIIITASLVAAAVTGQQPFNSNKLASAAIIDRAATYGVFTSLLAGPIVGVVWHRRKVAVSFAFPLHPIRDRSRADAVLKVT